jgi:hypothetical protein
MDENLYKRIFALKLYLATAIVACMVSICVATIQTVNLRIERNICDEFAIKSHPIYQAWVDGAEVVDIDTVGCIYVKFPPDTLPRPGDKR